MKEAGHDTRDMLRTYKWNTTNQQSSVMKVVTSLRDLGADVQKIVVGQRVVEAPAEPRGRAGRRELREYVVLDRRARACNPIRPQLGLPL